MTATLFAILALLAFAALALSQPKHHRNLTGKPASPSRRAALHVTGWVALAGALALAIHDHGLGYGLVLLSGALMVSGWIVAMILAVRAR
jgi:hypothetical protein